MTSKKDIEHAAESYAERRRQLADVLLKVQEEQRQIINRHLRTIRLALAATSTAGDELKNLIEGAPELFEKPRTVTFHGIKCGLLKGKGKVLIDDEAKTIGLIRKLLPKDQAELLINVKESVHKPSVADLSTTDLKRLAIRIESTGDTVVMKSTDSELEKMIQSLLADINDAEEAAA